MSFPFSFLDLQIFISNVSGVKSMLAIILLVLLVLYVRNSLKALHVVLFSSVIAMSITEGIKHLFKIPRPEFALIYDNTYRFPSAHATMAAVLMTLVIVYGHKYIKNETWKSFIYLAGVLWFVAVCYSRLYLQVHYFIDIAVGGIIGIASTFIVMKVFKRLG